MPSESRNLNIDAFRVYAFVVVVTLHVYQPLFGTINLGQIGTSALRWAVPFYFLASGFFLERSRSNIFQGLKKLLIRLAPPMVFWVIVYSIARANWSSLLHPQFFLLDLISGGAGDHLWFLPALGISAAIVLLCKRFGDVPLLLIGACLFATGLAFGPYRASLELPVIPFAHGVDFKMRWGPFEGTLFVGIGYVIAKHRFKVGIPVAVSMILAGLACQVAEMFAIHATGGDFYAYDFLIGTIPLGTGIFLLANALPRFRVNDYLARWGGLVFGAYCIHLLFVGLSRYYVPQNTKWWVMLTILGITILSLASSYWLARIPIVNRFVK